jgi:hypothetical protein
VELFPKIWGNAGWKSEPRSSEDRVGGLHSGDTPVFLTKGMDAMNKLVCVESAPDFMRVSSELENAVARDTKL